MKQQGGAGQIFGQHDHWSNQKFLSGQVWVCMPPIHPQSLPGYPKGHNQLWEFGGESPWHRNEDLKEEMNRQGHFMTHKHQNFELFLFYIQFHMVRHLTGCHYWRKVCVCISKENASFQIVFYSSETILACENWSLGSLKLILMGL